MKTVNLSTALRGLELPPSAGTVVSEREQTTDELQYSTQLLSSFSSMKVEDKGSMVVGFSTSASLGAM